MKKIIAIALITMMTLVGISFGSVGPDSVSAATGGGGGGGTSGGGTTGTAPKAPTTLALPSGYTVADSSVNIVWKDNATDESGFKVERVAKGGPAWVQVASVAADTQNYTDTGLNASTTYFYRIKAWNAYGTSVASNELIVTTAKSSSPTPLAKPPTYNSTPSVWAAAEIELAKVEALTVDSLMSQYNKPITRAEFAALVVKLYEKATGDVVVPVSPNPFTDTTDQIVLKAYTVGIINGVSSEKFAPTANVSRQEMALMLQRELKAANPSEDYDVSDDFTTIFTDQNKIGAWALAAVRFMNHEGIVNGIGGGNIDPTGNATREQAMLMVYRNYMKFVVSDDIVTEE